MSRYDRQSFLGPNSDSVISDILVGFVGAGGGNSHTVQQYAHIGGRRAVIVDPDIIEDTNLNRLVGGTIADVHASRHKVDIAYRVISGVVNDPEVTVRKTDWQSAMADLKGCDVIIGGVDSVVAKDQLDDFCKRYCIPYIDMGMDVHPHGEHFQIAGQVVLTSPGGPCLRCLNVIKPEDLVREHENYGAAGSKPQVVWPNGVLASTAIGLLVQLITPWHANTKLTQYLEYDGNAHTMRVSQRLQVMRFDGCPHRPKDGVGDHRFDIRNPLPPLAGR